MNKAVFFDRDGTLIEEKNYLSDIKDIRIFDDAYKALKLTQDKGYKLIIVSNQSGVARGYFSINTVEKINRAIVDDFAGKGINIDGVYYCPHYEKGAIAQYSIKCNCRKPNIGMAEMARNDFSLDLSQCFMIGDKESDIQFGHSFGARASILINTGYGDKISNSRADYRFDNIYDACCKICSL